MSRRRVAIVTGGASGIGAAITSRLREDGLRVFVFDRTALDEADSLAVDIADDAAVRSAVSQAAEVAGGIDVVVNNAGIGAQGTIEDNSDEEWHRVFDVNVLGAVRVTRAALPWLRASDSAAVVNISSIVATTGLSQRALYGATKGAIASLTLQMAADHLGDGIRVNSVNPGTADTPWVQRLLDSAADPVAERAALEGRQPHGRLVRPEEIAAVVSFLVDPRSGSVTGASVAVDGGMASLRPRPRAGREG